MKRAYAVAAGLAILSMTPAMAGNIKERTTYFMVKGSTFAELDRALGASGPRITSLGGERRAGATQVGFDGHVTYKPVGSRCGIGNASFSLDLHTTLPRWEPPKRADAETRILWKTLHEDIVTHERHHSVIAKNWLRRIEATVSKLPAERDCPSMERVVNATTRKLLAQHARAQLAFDADESEVIDARLQRKVAHNMRQLAGN